MWKGVICSYKQEKGKLRTEVENIILERKKRIMNIIVTHCSNVFEAPRPFLRRRPPSQRLGVCGGRLGDAIHTL